MSKREAAQIPGQEAKKLKESIDETAADSNQARYFSSTATEDRGHQKLASWRGTSGPSSEEDIQTLHAVNKFRHGDVISFGDRRDLEAYFVSTDPEGKTVTLLKNKDESGAGYLTVPYDILKNVDNFHNKYESIIKHSTRSVNFHPKGSDEFLASYLGDLPDDGWEYDITFTRGQLEDFSVRPKGEEEEFVSFKIDDITWEDILEFFEARSGPMTEIRVKVKLEGHIFDQYKSKYASGGHLKEWMTAVPDLPVGWRCQRAGSSGGATKFNWTWKLRGPANTDETMRENIKTFLAEFPHEFVG